MYHVTHTGGNSESVRDYFQPRMNKHLLLEPVFTAAAWRTWDRLKINYTAHRDEGTCHPAQQSRPLNCF